MANSPLVVAFLVACSQPDAPPPQTPSAEVEHDTASTPVEQGWLPPSVRIVGEPGQSIADAVAIAASDDEPGMFLLDGPWPEPGWVVPVPLEPGTWPVRDLWDGVSTYDVVGPPAISAGDVDDDGHRDLWIGYDLFLGPIAGRSLRRGEGHARVAPEAGIPLAAGFDADGDGHEDLAVSGHGDLITVYHGPFQGDVPTVAAGTADPSQVTVFGADLVGEPLGPVRVYQDHLGPGQHAIGGVDSEDPASTWLFALNQPRGTSLDAADAFAFHVGPDGESTMDPVRDLLDAGDVNGDGMPDVQLEFDHVVAGPLQGSVPFYEGVVEAVAFPDGDPVRSLGDLNGDGASEVLVLHHIGAGVTLVVAFSPHAAVVDLSAALPIDASSVTYPEWVSATDLDGDLLPDLVIGDWHGSDPEELQVWFGKDLLAWQAER